MPNSGVIVYYNISPTSFNYYKHTDVSGDNNFFTQYAAPGITGYNVSWVVDLAYVDNYFNTSQRYKTVTSFDYSAGGNNGDTTPEVFYPGTQKPFYTYANELWTYYVRKNTVSAKTYNYYYNANGGDSTPASGTVTYDTSFTFAAAITRYGYDFTNWSGYGAGGTITWQFDSNPTFYANWNAMNRIHYFNINDGVLGSITKWVLFDTIFRLPVQQNHNKTGYTHIGWDTWSPRWNRTIYGDVNTDIMFDFYWHDVGWNARYTPNSYQLYYNLNGGTGLSGGTNSGTVNYDGLYSTPGIPTRTGYTFTKWRDDDGGLKNANESYTWKYLKNITLTAQWTINQYNVTYDGNGKSATIVKTNNYQVSITHATLTAVGYTFLRWTTGADGSGTIYNIGTTYTIPAGDTTLYAQWQDDTPTTGLKFSNIRTIFKGSSDIGPVSLGAYSQTYLSKTAGTVVATTEFKGKGLGTQ